GPPDPNEATHGDQTFALFISDRENKAYLVREIQLGELSQHLRCKPCNRSKKPPVNATGRESVEREPQALLIVTMYGPKVDPGAVTKRNIPRDLYREVRAQGGVPPAGVLRSQGFVAAFAAQALRPMDTCPDCPQRSATARGRRVPCVGALSPS